MILVLLWLYLQVTYKGIEPTYMPLTGIATIALDEIIFNKQQTIERCLRYLSTDTVRLAVIIGRRCIVMNMHIFDYEVLVVISSWWSSLHPTQCIIMIVLFGRSALALSFL